LNGSRADGEAGELLVVDDQPEVRHVLERILVAGGHRCRTAGSVGEARRAIDAVEPQLVLCDIDMPGESGLVLVEHLARHHPDVAVLMVTAVDDPSVADEALDDGAFGYVIKPFERNEILIGVRAALRRRAAALAERAEREVLTRAVAERTAQLQASLHQLDDASAALGRSEERSLRQLACAAEFRDPETSQHLERMSRYSALLGAAAGLEPERCELLRLASPMHDVGKIGIPDEILLKDGPFTAADRAVMERHPVLGHEILAGGSSPLLEMAALVALHHHEKVDGSGYPSGLRGEDISIEGRIVAVADVFDALTSARRYKGAMTVEAACGVMREGRGTHFDARLLDLFFSCLDEVERIMRRWSEPAGV
jgi:putative two-component system response regulator